MEPRRHLSTSRIILGTLLFSLVIIGPYWLLGIVALVGYFWFPPYWEMLFAAIFFDLLYYSPAPAFYAAPLFATFLALSLLAVMIFAGEQLRLPSRRRSF